MLEAKHAIMDEHHRRFQTLHQEGRWEEALQEIQVTLSCAADLLNGHSKFSRKLFDDTRQFPSPPQPRD
jgi:hypothetical protein